RSPIRPRRSGPATPTGPSSSPVRRPHLWPCRRSRWPWTICSRRTSSRDSHPTTCLAERSEETLLAECCQDVLPGTGQGGGLGSGQGDRPGACSELWLPDLPQLVYRDLRSILLAVHGDIPKKLEQRKRKIDLTTFVVPHRPQRENARCQD